MKKKVSIALLVLVIPLTLWFFFFRTSERPDKLPRRYRIEALREEEGSVFAYPTSLNNEGQMVGLKSTHQPKSGFYWNRDRGFISLDKLEPRSINDLGQIDGVDSTGKIGIRMIVGATGPVEIARQTMFSPVDNNNLGEAIEGGSFRALIWNATRTLIDINAGKEPKIGLRSINDHGIAVGTLAHPKQSMILRNPGGDIRELGSLRTSEVHPRRINNLGQVVGICMHQGHRYAFFWTEEEGMTFFGGPLPPKSYGYYPLGLNDSGQTVGTRGNDFKMDWLHQTIVKSSQSISISLRGWLDSKWPTTHSSAFLWEDGVLFDLEWFLPEETEWERLEAATDINNQGQIIGVGVIEGANVGFLMTPEGE